MQKCQMNRMMNGLLWVIMMTLSNRNIFHVTEHLCGEFTGPGEFPTQRPVTRSFDVFFDLRLNKRLSKQWGWWFEMPSRPLWRHHNMIFGHEWGESLHEWPKTSFTLWHTLFNFVHIILCFADTNPIKTCVHCSLCHCHQQRPILTQYYDTMRT